MEAIAGFLVLYLTLTAIGILTTALWSDLSHRYLNNLRHRSNSLLWRGLTITLFVLAVAILWGSVEKQLESGVKAIGLLVILILAGYIFAFLVGYGTLAWYLGERIMAMFGKTDAAPGWSIMLGSVTILTVVWVPLFGWALGIYWIALCVGNVIATLGIFGAPMSQDSDKTQPPHL